MNTSTAKQFGLTAKEEKEIMSTPFFYVNRLDGTQINRYQYNLLKDSQKLNYRAI